MESQQTGWEAPTQGPAYTPPPQPKKSKAPLIIGLALLLVIVVIAVAIVVVFLPFLGGKPTAPRLMSADMEVYASIKADLGDLAGFKHLAEIYGDINEVEDALDDLEDGLDDELGITWKDDIQPWLGSEVAVGMTDLQSALEGYEVPSFVVMAQTRNKKASSEFIEKVVEYVEDEDWDVDEDSYQGVDYFILELDQAMYLGTVKDFVVLATDEDAMEDVIDASTGRIDSLEDNERFKDLMSTLPADAVAYAILDPEKAMADAVDEFEQELEYFYGITPPREITREITDLYESYGAYGVALGVHDDGIQLDIVTGFDTDKLNIEFWQIFQTEASANRILDRMPEDALGFYSGYDLARIWRTVNNFLKEVPDADEQVEDLADELGIRFDDEFLSWLSGEFAVAVVKSRSVEDIPVGGFAVFEVDDAEKAGELMEDIFNAVEDPGFYEIDEDTIEGVDMTLIVEPRGGEVLFGYGFDDKHLVLGLPEDGLKQAVGDAASVTRNDYFKAVQKRLPSKTTGYLFINLEQVMSVVVGVMSDWEREDYEDNFEPLIEPIKAIGLAGEPMDMGKGIAHSTLFIYIP